MNCFPAHLPRSMLLQWHLTERCNLRCSHCYQEGCKPADLSYAALLEVLEQFEQLLAYWRKESQGRFQKAHITVTGGEPFVRDDFIDLLEVFSAKRKNFSFAVLTNGTCIDRGIARTLKRLGTAFVQVSVEGTREAHDRIRNDSYEETVRGIKCLTRAGLRVLISFTAHRQNFREFPAVAKLGRRLGVSRVWTDRFIPISEQSAKEIETLTPRETEELIDIIRKSQNAFCLPWKRKTEIASLRALQFLASNSAPYSCSAGDTLLTIQSNGDVVPCRRMPIVLGNVLKTPLRRLYEDSDILRDLRTKGVPEKCSGCGHARECRGGLKCLAYAVTGDYFEADPGCWLAGGQ